MPTPQIEYGVTISPITGRPIYRNAREEREAWQAGRRATATTPTTPTTPVIPGLDTDLLGVVTQQDTPPGGPGIPGAQPFQDETDKIIQELLNPPAYFADVDRRAAEVAAGRGISGSEAGFGTGLRMTDEERIRRQTLGANILGAREEAARQDIENANRERELDLREEQIRADIALGNRTARNQEELTRIQRERAELEAERNQLERDIQTRLGTPNTTRGARPASTRINIAGTGWPARWIDWPLG